MKHRYGLMLAVTLAVVIGILCTIPEAHAAVGGLTGGHLAGLGSLAGMGAMGFAPMLIGDTKPVITSKNLRQLQARKAEKTKAWRAILDKAKADGDRDLNDEEQKQAAALSADVARLNARVDEEIALIEAELSSGLALSPDARIEGGDPQIAKDPKRGFRSLGDFAQSVRRAAVPGGSVDQKLAISAALPSNYGNETSGADGGFLVPPEFSQNVWRQSLGEDSLLPLTDNTEISGNSMAFPKDETTPWGSTGVKAYWRAEAAAASASKPVTGLAELRLHELMALVPVTNELLEDAPALSGYLQPAASDSIRWKTNEAILFGTGVGQPLGCLGAGSGPLITVSKESGQAAATIVQANLSKMVSRLVAGQLMNSIWIGNPDVLPALEAMAVGNYPVYLPNNSAEGPAYGRLKGRPLMLSEHANALGAKGDISLLSLKGYRTITKAGGIQSATSMHLYFDVNATAFRFIFRVDGKPILSAAVPAPTGKSSNTRSHFVTLEAR